MVAPNGNDLQWQLVRGLENSVLRTADSRARRLVNVSDRVRNDVLGFGSAIGIQNHYPLKQRSGYYLDYGMKADQATV